MGERWQILDPEDKEQYERQAATAKEQYNASLAKYRRTSQYRTYQTYLAEFKARNTPQPTAGMLKRPIRKVLAQSQAGTKRPKLETEISGTSSGSGSSVPTLFNDSSEALRNDSIISQSTYSPTISSMISPTIVTRLATRSQESSIHASSPITPIHGSTPLSGSSNIASTQGGFEGAPQQLPRILPLETRDSRPHINSLLTDSSSSSNPRRTSDITNTTTTTRTTLLRHDTSKSSHSSNLSGASTLSPGYISGLSFEEKRSGRSLPPIPGLTHHTSLDSAITSDGDHRQARGISPRFRTELSDPTSNQSIGLWGPAEITCPD